MIIATIHHPKPGETSTHTTVKGVMGQVQIYSAETGDREGAIIVNRKEALAMAAAFAAAFAELAKDIQGAEGIAKLVKGAAA